MGPNGRIFRWISAVALLFILTAGSTPVTSLLTGETVAVIGTGRVGGALGPRFAKLGYVVVYGSRDPTQAKVKELVARTGEHASAASQRDAVKKADIVVLAVPWTAAEGVIKGVGDLDGKIIIDVTNAIRMSDDGHMERAVETSGAELIQSWAPGAALVKAFNVMSYLVMADPSTAGGPVTVPVVGDDREAKQKVREIIEAMGFESEDLGPLRNAQYLEGMAVLYMVPLLEGRMADSFEYYLRKNPERYGPNASTEVRAAE